ncbi:hypothetical protein CSAL01_07678 [Colletotrichum salicis]|uniref:Uncharacterized protein n=1 Tax=Colletotrichum salicis TaxID=1209931 RepID=A0A135RVE4_9PEZI|nr:hypothetical protein CSAL01_07678 [Colletotrichum salicis]
MILSLSLSQPSKQLQLTCPPQSIAVFYYIEADKMKFNLLALAAIVSLAMAAPVPNDAVTDTFPGGKPWKRDEAGTDTLPGRDW